MPGSAKLKLAPPKRIELPRSSTRLQIPQVYVRIVTAIRPEPFGAVAFDGPLHAPGHVVDFESLPVPAVAIECAGPVGVFQRGKHREILYILWRFDFGRGEWTEIAQARALDWRWTVALRDAAAQALSPRPELVDVTRRSRDIAEEILGLIDGKLRMELPDVKASALHTVYERVAGRIACA